MTRFTVASVCLTAALCTQASSPRSQPLQACNQLPPQLRLPMSTYRRPRGPTFTTRPQTESSPWYPVLPFRLPASWLEATGNISLPRERMIFIPTKSHPTAQLRGGYRSSIHSRIRAASAAPLRALFSTTRGRMYTYLSRAPRRTMVMSCVMPSRASSISSSGDLTFKGDVLVDEDAKASGTDTLPVLLGNNTFAYSLEGIPDSCAETINIFAREGSGALEFAAGKM